MKCVATWRPAHPEADSESFQVKLVAATLGFICQEPNQSQMVTDGGGVRPTRLWD